MDASCSLTFNGLQGNIPEDRTMSLILAHKCFGRPHTTVNIWCNNDAIWTVPKRSVFLWQLSWQNVHLILMQKKSLFFYSEVEFASDDSDNDFSEDNDGYC
jgi:hypothetical protein